MDRFEVEFYEKVTGEQPVRDFLLGLDPKMRAKTVHAIELLRDNGFYLREPYSRAVRDGIFELRVKLGSNITRILYFFYVGHHIILTNGFVKKTKKTPAMELERAERYREDYCRRARKENHE